MAITHGKRTWRSSFVTALAMVVVAGAGLLASAAADTEPADATPPPLPRPSSAISPRLDGHGDPLPEGAMLRLGTVRYRDGSQI